MQTKKLKGYTLIELIVVFFIIVILFVSTLPIYFAAKQKTDFEKSINNIMNIVYSAIDLSNDPTADASKYEDVCLVFEKNINTIGYVLRSGASTSCYGATIDKSIVLDKNYNISCDECTLALPINASVSEQKISINISSGLLHKKITISSVGTINVE